MTYQSLAGTIPLALALEHVALVSDSLTQHLSLLCVVIEELPCAGDHWRTQCRDTVHCDCECGAQG